MNINKVDLSDRFAEMWRSSREIAGYSQEHMAKALGVSRKTVQNWESGTSCPSQQKGFEWFDACGLQPLPFYLKLLFPEEFIQVNKDVSDAEIEDFLLKLITDLPMAYKRKLLYLLAGQHGSSPMCVLEMLTAHLQVPLRARLNVAESIYTNYEMSDATNEIRHPEHIQPNMELLRAAIDAARRSLKEGNDGYTSQAFEGGISDDNCGMDKGR